MRGIERPQQSTKEGTFNPGCNGEKSAATRIERIIAHAKTYRTNVSQEQKMAAACSILKIDGV